METNSLLEELIKHGSLITFLGISLYVFYKKDELRRINDLKERDIMQTKLDTQEARIESYLKNDSLTMQDLIKSNIQTTEKQTAMMNKTNEVMSCIVKEIQDFKRSEIYQFHEKNSKS